MLGRPTVITTETLDKLREAFLMGYSDREACIYADIGLQTLYDYQKGNADFSEQKEAYKSNPVLKAKKTIYEEIENGNLKITMWYLERKAKDEFSLRQEHNIKNGPTDTELAMVINKLETDANTQSGDVTERLGGLFGTISTSP